MKQYAKPPITEAIVEIQPQSEFSAKVFERLQRKFRKAYPIAQAQYEAKIEFNGETVDASAINVGFRFASSEGTETLLLRKRAFGTSRLAPYCGWETFSGKFFSELEVVSSISNLSVPGRIGVRFINRIDVPNGGGNTKIEDYMRLSINTPDKNDVVSRYSFQVSFPRPELGCNITVNSAILPPPLIDVTSFLLDIDIGMQVPSLAPGKIKEHLVVMRTLKNESFESYITDKTRELFEANAANQ